MKIEPYTHHHLDAVVRLSLRAWTPVFESIQKAMNAEAYLAFYPDHWRVSQEKAVEEVCSAEDIHVWVAIDSDAPVGFVAVKLNTETTMGEIYMVAVDPDFQGIGMGTALTTFPVRPRHATSTNRWASIRSRLPDTSKSFKSVLCL
jgi:ribosomal protein S18 acetylase RimI-like enzyme